LIVEFTRVRPEGQAPAQAHEHDAGYDLFAAEALSIEAGERASVATGIAVAIPEGNAGFVLPRSGLAARQGVTLVNSPGLIDAGFRGELRVLLLNTDRREPFRVEVGDRIAQLVVLPVMPAEFVEAAALSVSSRGAGGFGSTGVR
jgi:dUTP pyrophosphatase